MVSILFGTAVGVSCGGGSKTGTSSPPEPVATTTPVQLADTQTVSIESPDKTVLIGSLFESSKPNSPGLLLLHQWESDRHSYDELARILQKRGFTVLAIDGRGFGESVRTADGREIKPDRSSATVKAMLQDVGASVDFLTKQPSVNPAKIGIVGASYGSSLALIYAADEPKIRAVALLSPGLNYFGNMPTEPAVEKFTDRNSHNLLFIAAKDDKESAEAVQKLNRMEVDNYRYPLMIYDSGGHGTALLKVGASELISNFFANEFNFANLNVRP